MSRFTGPRLKVMRALGTDLPGLSRKTIENRPNPPGQHGGRGMRRKKSDFGVKLMEKQKLRFNYGLTETQLRRLMIDARRGNAPTGETLLQLLERRLDNVVFRAEFAPTIAAARQLVNHGHLLLNGKAVNIPSIRIRLGDEISMRAESLKIPLMTETLKDLPLTRPEWLAWNDQASIAKISHMPAPEDVPFPVDVQQVVEYYANRL
jgi:small subunit ribosomal protein S4